MFQIQNLNTNLFRDFTKLRLLFQLISLILLSNNFMEVGCDQNTSMKYTMQFHQGSTKTNPEKFRKILGEPRSMMNSGLKIFVIKKYQSSSLPNQIRSCIVINAINFLLPVSLQSAQKLGGFGIQKIVIFANPLDKTAEQFIANQFNSNHYNIDGNNVIPDSKYNFLNKNLAECERIIYLQSNFRIEEQQNAQKIIQRVHSMDPFSCQYSQIVLKCYSSTDREQIPLKNLAEVDLEGVTPLELSSYIFLFDPLFLRILTPLNFAFYNRYTLDQMIIYPLLALLQNSASLKSFSEVVHSIQTPILQSQDYKLIQPQKSGQNSLCFLSFPNKPQEHSSLETQNYLESFNTMKKNKAKKVSLVMFAPYNFKFLKISNRSLLGIGLQLLSLPKLSLIRLRIRVNKTTSSLGSYEAAYTYCPKQSILVISRQNIYFSSQFVPRVIKQVSKKFEYYLAYFLLDSKPVNFTQKNTKIQPSFRRVAQMYNNITKHLQIIKSQFFKTIYFWILKCEQVDFYQTEASFIFPLLEMNGHRFKIIPAYLFKIISKKETFIEIKQLRNIKMYYVWPEIDRTNLIPFQHNALSNTAFKRYASIKIPKKIHQIWLGQSKIVPLRKKLSQTVQQKNVGFQYKLWKQSDISIQNFPLTYSLLMKIKETQKHQKRSLAATMADLLRLQILLNNGGIYLDYKVQCLKPLDPFLKYKIFFIDMDYIRRSMVPQFIGNTFIGAEANNYYIKFLLTQILVEEKIDPATQKLPKVTGAYPLKRAFNLQQLFTVPGFGFQLFSQNPNSQLPLKCTNPRSISDKQQKFYVQSVSEKHSYIVAIPCYAYPEAYLVMYKELGGTWLNKK